MANIYFQSYIVGQSQKDYRFSSTFDGPWHLIYGKLILYTVNTVKDSTDAYNLKIYNTISSVNDSDSGHK